ncbi:MAG: hypothetical protein LBQ13_00795 [Endomicrobium sp.]|jgi:tRNA-dihydrouridine synthase|nr:hypothetical protein [Endomicrobium sp.]
MTEEENKTLKKYKVDLVLSGKAIFKYSWIFEAEDEKEALEMAELEETHKEELLSFGRPVEVESHTAEEIQDGQYPELEKYLEDNKDDFEKSLDNREKLRMEKQRQE